jgi:hypothetical protein
MEGLPDLAALREHFGRVFSGFSDAPEEFDDAHEVARDPPQPPGDKELREQPAGFGQQTVVTATAAGDFCGLQWTAVESLGPELSHLHAPAPARSAYDQLLEWLPDLAALRERFGSVFSGSLDAPEEFDDAHEVEWNLAANAEAKIVYEQVMEELDVAMLAGAEGDQFAQAAEAAVRAEQAARQAAVLETFSQQFRDTLAKAAKDERYMERIDEVEAELCRRREQLRAIEAALVGTKAEPMVNPLSRGSKDDKRLKNPTKPCEFCGTHISTGGNQMQIHLKRCKRKPVIVAIEPAIYIMAELLGIRGGRSEEMLVFLRDFVPENGDLTRDRLRDFLLELKESGHVQEPLLYYNKIQSLVLAGKEGIDLQKELQTYALEDTNVLFDNTHDETAFKEKVRPLVLVLVKRMLLCQRFHCEWLCDFGR